MMMMMMSMMMAVVMAINANASEGNAGGKMAAPGRPG
jgi:hypothetical protein